MSAKLNFFLRTKLLPPREVAEYLHRPRLTEKLRANVNMPVTLVAADAGCGKTTLVADFLRRQERESVWYQLDHTDADPFVFLGYIARGIKKFAPDFGETFLPYLTEASEDLIKFPERAVDLLLNEILDGLEQPFILVLDDYHHIGRETIVHRLVDRLLQYSSDMIHLLITTRDLPPLAIMRRRTQSAALIIPREELLFTDEEVRELFRKTLQVELKDEEIADYREKTQGWITALQLVRQSAEQEIYAHTERRTIDLQAMLNQSEKNIFDYFAEEVFEREPEETQKLLLYLSLLQTLPLDACSRLFPEMRCGAALPELVQKNIFLTVAGDSREAEEYRLHPLFRGFLQRRLRSEIGREAVTEERSRIAEYYLGSSQSSVNALPYLIEAENYDRAAEIVAAQGGDWIAGGAFVSLGLFADEIPLEFLEKHPRALLHKAEIARLQGDMTKSSSLLNRAVKLLHAQKDAEGEAEAQHSLASLARRRQKFEEAVAYLEKAEKLIGEDTETYLKCANTRGLCLIAQGAWNAAEQQFHYALELAEKQSNEHFTRLITHNLALPAGFRGDFGEALRWFKRIFREDKKEKRPLPQEAIGHLNVGRLHLYRGEFEETEKHLDRALELCQLYDLKSLRGEIFEAFADFYRDREDFARAAEFYERAEKAYEAAGVNLATRELDEERAKFYLLRGDAAKARGLIENLIEARTKLNNEAGTQTARLALCRVRLAQNETDGLAEEIKQIQNFLHDQNLNFNEAHAALLLAETFFALGERKKMMPALQRVLDLSARLDYEFWLKNEIRRHPQLFSDEDVIEKLPLDLREALKSKTGSRKPEAAVHQSPIIIQTVSAITDLTVRTLGFVEIFRDPAKQFAADAWTTRRARDIFCYIATSSHRRVEKDVLIDVFWGADDLKTVEKNFHPTISHVRKALNSRQSFKQNFLIFRDGAYQLNPELSYSIDTEEFENYINRAERAKQEKDTESFRANLEAARALYRGEYMAGVYDDWAEDRRPFYAEQLTRVLNALAKLSFSEKKWSNAIKYAGDILQTDPFREDAHRLLMKVFAAQGKRAKVLEQFETLQKLLKEELGVSPAPETRRAMQELTK